jgi:hypothetical protein
VFDPVPDPLTEPIPESNRAPETDIELATRLAIETGIGLVNLREQMFADHMPSWQVMDGGDAAAPKIY